MFNLKTDQNLLTFILQVSILYDEAMVAISKCLVMVTPITVYHQILVNIYFFRNISKIHFLTDKGASRAFHGVLRKKKLSKI